MKSRVLSVLAGAIIATIGWMTAGAVIGSSDVIAKDASGDTPLLIIRTASDGHDYVLCRKTSGRYIEPFILHAAGCRKCARDKEVRE